MNTESKYVHQKRQSIKFSYNVNINCSRCTWKGSSQRQIV